MVLVIGGTGVLGLRVVRLLRGTGREVRVMSRAPHKAEAVLALGAQVVPGDLTTPQSLRLACVGASQVLAAAHGLLGRGRHDSASVDDAGHRALIDAARHTGVPRFVYVSALGASPLHPVDFWRTKYAVEQHLKSSGLAHVILRPSAFMEWHAHEFIGKAIVAGGKARLIGPGTKPRNFIAADDVAQVAVRALDGDFADGAVLELGGPGNHTNLEVAEQYARVCGVALRTSHLPRGVAAAIATVIRPLHPGIARVLALSSLPDEAFDERFDQAASCVSLECAKTTLADFVARQVAAARGGGAPDAPQ